MGRQLWERHLRRIHLAHAGAIVNNESSNVFVTHLDKFMNLLTSVLELTTWWTPM